MSLAIATVSLHSPNAAAEFTQSLQHSGVVILEDTPISPIFIQEVYDAWKMFFQSGKKYDYPFNIETTDGFVSTVLSETAKGNNQKRSKGVLSSTEKWSVSRRAEGEFICII